MFGASKKRPGASRGANRDAKLSTHLIVVVDAVVVFARALWLERMIAGLVNRRPRGASRDCEDRRGIGRAMSRGEVSWARNKKWITPSAGNAPSYARSSEFSRDVRILLPLLDDVAAFEAVNEIGSDGKMSDPRLRLVFGLEVSVTRPGDD